MASSSFRASQRQHLEQQAAQQMGIHQPLLTALYAVQQQPHLAEGETGLGITPAGTLSLSQVQSLGGQIAAAAKTLRSLSDRLTAQGWQGADFWDSRGGYYRPKFLYRVAEGYRPAALETGVAQLEPCDAQALVQAYGAAVAQQRAGVPLGADLSYLDDALTHFGEQVPRFYHGLPFQRQALVETLRLWRKLPSLQAAIASLGSPNFDLSAFDRSAFNRSALDRSALDRPDSDRPDSDRQILDRLDLELLQFLQRTLPYYSHFPHQREALLRLVQLWRQLSCREWTIVSLAKDTSPHTDLQVIDPALIAFVQRVPGIYRRTGIQRHALTEGFRHWHQLDSRSAALTALGVDPSLFSQTHLDSQTIQQAAGQADRALLNFIRSLPGLYRGNDRQRQALICLVQLWRSVATETQTIEGLIADIKAMTTARPGTPEAAPVPSALSLTLRPDHWTPKNLDLQAPLFPDSSFTWAEVTQGGLHWPPDQGTIEAVLRLAPLAEQIRHRIARPLTILTWYDPHPRWPHQSPQKPQNQLYPKSDDQIDDILDDQVDDQPYGINPSTSKPFSQPSYLQAQLHHQLGDAMVFYASGLSADQIYWTLDPWWPGGLGRFQPFPLLCYVDAGGDRCRWHQT